MPNVLAVVDDLLFSSRIREAARASGAQVLDHRQAFALGGEPPALVLVDADSDRVDWEAIVARIRALPQGARIHVVAFVSHTDRARASRARRSGVDRVLARSAFVRELPALLATAANPRSISEET